MVVSDLLLRQLASKFASIEVDRESLSYCLTVVDGDLDDDVSTIADDDYQDMLGTLEEHLGCVEVACWLSLIAQTQIAEMMRSEGIEAAPKYSLRPDDLTH